MEIWQLSALSAGNLGGVSIDCRCRLTHTVTTGQIVFGAGISAELPRILGAVVPAGCKIAALTEEKLYEDIARPLIRRLERAGYRITGRCFDAPPDDIEGCQTDISEDTLAVLGIGGGAVADAAKYTSSMRGLPCILILTSPAVMGGLVPSAMLFKDGFVEVYKAPPPAALVCDTDFFDTLPPEAAAAALGEIAGVLCALFDWRVARLLTGEYYCPYLAQAADDIISSLLGRLKDSPAALPAEVMAWACECALKLSAVTQMIGNSRLTCGGEAHVAHALLMLLRRQARERRLWGEYVHITAVNTLQLYINELNNNIAPGFIPPPDNNARMDKIAGYLKVPWLRAGDKIGPPYDKRTYDISAYKLIECRGELTAEASAALDKVLRLRHAARKMYDDFGYELGRHISAADLDICTALAPDIREKFSLLTQFKNMGLLERLYDN